MNKVSKTDWKRLAEMDDSDINTSDIPEWTILFSKKPKSTCRRSGRLRCA